MSEASANDTTPRPLEEENEDDAPVFIARNIWDLTREETPDRERAAINTVWRAYITDSIANGFERNDSGEAFVAKLEQTETHLARIAGERVRTSETSDEGGHLQGVYSVAKLDERTAEATMNEEVAAKILVHIKTHGPCKPADIFGVVASKAVVQKTLGFMLKKKELAHNGKGGRKTLYGLPGERFDAENVPGIMRAKSLEAVAKKPRAPRAKLAAEAKWDGKGDPAKFGHVRGIAALEQAISDKRAELAGLERALAIICGET